MKRINPKTNKPFKLGDIREDGFIFRAYDLSYIKKDGTFAERWMSPWAFWSYKYDNKIHQKNYRQAKKIKADNEFLALVG